MKMMNFNDFCYTIFGPMGKFLFHFYKGLESRLDAANMKFHPEVYLSIVSFFTVLTSSLVLSTYLLFRFVEGVSFLAPIYFFVSLLWSNPTFYTFLAASPFIVLMVGFSIPSIKASNRISGLKNEIPYASMHMSVMASGGLNPYTSLLRLKKTSLLPNLHEEVGRIQSIILSSGCDPVSAMEKAARVIGLREYKDLLLGYASTLRTGGDVLHYLYSQTQAMFKNMATRVKAMGESMGALMEAYSIVEILGALGLYMMFVIGFSLPEAGITLSSENFFIFSFIVLPLTSIVFLYLCDTLQINYPVSYWRTYLVFLGTLPLTFLLATQMSLSFIYPEILLIPSLRDFTLYLTSLFGLGEGCEPAVGLTFTFIVSTIPALVLDHYYSREEKGIIHGITSFLRDLVENRKTGLSPERCLQILSSRDYGRFSKYLKHISSQISWGIPLREVLKDFMKNVRSWLAQINIYLLIDSIEVGGGTKESLENLAEFSESVKEIEHERKSVLAPLFIVPYIGAALLTMTTVLLLQFFNNILALAETSLPIAMLGRVLLTPLIFHAYMLGIVSGKITSGKVSGGFKHAMILVLISMLGIWLAFHSNFFSII